MFCARCGKEIPDGLNFCPNCGTQVRTAMQNTRDAAQQPANYAVNNSQQTAANANPYAGQSYGTAPVYGQQPGPNAGGYQQQTYGQNPQFNYQYNYQQNYQNPQAGYPQSFTVPEQKKSKKGLLIGLIAAAAIAIAAILLFVWPGFLTGGGGASTPEKTVQNFGTALQKMDFKGMIKCFDPESQKKLEGTLDQLGGLNLGGFDLSALIDMMNLKLSVDVTDVDYSSDRMSCRVQVNMKMSYSFMGYKDSNEDNFPLDLKKVGNKWYIDGSVLDLEDFLGDLMGGIY